LRPAYLSNSEQKRKKKHTNKRFLVEEEHAVHLKKIILGGV